MENNRNKREEVRILFCCRYTERYNEKTFDEACMQN